MAHKYPNVLIHFVFSTKERRALIADELQSKLWKYFIGIGTNHKIPVLAAGGIANHAHLLLALPSDVTIAKAIQVMKANSSRWIGEHGIEFAWQEGYGAFSVSASNKDAIVHYIEHHRSTTRSTALKMNTYRYWRNPDLHSSARKRWIRCRPFGTREVFPYTYPALPCRAFLWRACGAGVR